MYQSASLSRQGLSFVARTSCRLALLLSLIVVATGCPASGAKNVVSGTVKMSSGENVTGEVVFRNAEGKEGTTMSSNGKYSLENPPLGEVKIYVKSSMPPGGPKGGLIKGPTDPKLKDDPTSKVGAAETGVQPPAKYAKDNELKFTVKGGKETFNITLTP
jgi:hypothetical protein